MADQSDDVRLVAVGVTHVGMVRQNNEDAFVIADLDSSDDGVAAWDVPRPVGRRGALLAVSDGMGGAAAGEIASAMTVESLKNWLNTDRGMGTQALFEGAVGEANRSVYDAAQSAERRGMGATLTAVLVRGAVAHIAEVGDSRAYLVREGRIRQVTRDQSYVQMLVEQGLITRDQAESSPYRNVILQAMGQRPDVSVALGRLELRRGDRILLCSDGLSGKVLDEEMRDVLALSDTLESAASRLIDLANERGGEDNITVVIAEATGEGLSEAGSDERITRTLAAVREFDLRAGNPSQSSIMAAPVMEESKPSHITSILTPPPEGMAAAAAAPAAAPAPAPVTPVPSAPSPSAQSSIPWLWVAVAVVAIVVIAVAAYLLLK
jgi:serine/threonine protein phosphatase PrpC